MLFSKCLFTLSTLALLSSAAPLPISEIEKRDIVTVTAPTVEIFISNGVTYTFTQTSTTAAAAASSAAPAAPAADTTSSAAAAASTAAADTASSAAAAATADASKDDSTSSVESIIIGDADSTATPDDGLVHVVNVVSLPGAQLSESTFSKALSTTYARTANSAAYASAASAASAASDASASSDAAASAAPETTASSATAAAATSQVLVGASVVVGSSAAAVSEVAASSASSGAGSSAAAASSSAAASSTLASSGSSSSSSGSSSSGKLTGVPYAIVYSPYTDSGSCKDQSTIESDLSMIKGKGISEIRIYGNDCGWIEYILPWCSDNGIKVNQGFWISAAGVDSCDTAVSEIISAVKGGSAGFDWDVFSYFTVGNEVVNSGYDSASNLISKIGSVKSKLQAAGYTGKVTTSEPPVSYTKYPSLCTGSDIDFVGINPHSYFDQGVSAEEAGDFCKSEIELVQETCGSLDVVVTETGYPSQGATNGKNVPSEANQLLALQSIFDVVGTDVTILTTYNDFWKNPGPYGIEQYFGMVTLLD